MPPVVGVAHGEGDLTHDGVGATGEGEVITV